MLVVARVWEMGRKEKKSTKFIKLLFVSLDVVLIYEVLEYSCHPLGQPSPCCLSFFFPSSPIPPHLECYQFLPISRSYSK